MQRIRDFYRHFAWAIIAVGMVFSGAASAAVTDADRLELAKLEDYLNSLRSLEARFLQIAPDGSQSEGRLLMRRPGRMRFEYDPPSPILLVADGSWVIFHDKQLKQTSHVPLTSTPLAFLVAEKVAFGQVTVDGIERGGGVTRVTVHDPKKPKDGKLTMVFSDAPLMLRQWVVQDGNGQVTTVSLSGIRNNPDINSNLFYFVDQSPR